MIDMITIEFIANFSESFKLHFIKLIFELNMRIKLRKCFIFACFATLSLAGLNILRKYQSASIEFVRRESIKESTHKFQGFHLNKENKRNLLLRKDWHDHDVIRRDQQRTGPGEHGAPVSLMKSEKGKDAYAENGFNIKVSDRISLNRSLSDIRHRNCKSRQYLVGLPKASIIIPFHNEGWSTLFRTLHSILNRTPPGLLQEIILVDDFSYRLHLQEKLTDKLKEYPKVKLVRLRQREGLIRARLAGVQLAAGEVIVILDSHVEVTHNWLPPLLEPIALDRKVVTCPMIDIIDKDNFRYLTQPGDAMRGAFDWELYYKRIPIPPDRQLVDPSDPFEDPVMAGGLFAIDLSYFKEIGQYDPGLEIWGGEQYELSFKVWMCGGRILDAPCSRVGHVYRQFMPYSLPRGTNINKNFKRVAEVWMDEYKEYFYKKRPHARRIDPGNLDNQIELRRKLKCKSFDWFMKEVGPDILKHYPPVSPKPAAWGTLRNEGASLCLDAAFKPEGGAVALSKCDDQRRNSEQKFILTWREDIRPGRDVERARKVCLDGQSRDEQVVMWGCHGQFGNQLWKYQNEQFRLYHSYTGLCATATADASVVLSPCNGDNSMQRWTWQHCDVTMLEKFNSNPDKPV